MVPLIISGWVTYLFGCFGAAGLVALRAWVHLLLEGLLVLFPAVRAP